VSAEPLPPDTIAATNVRPAFETSLHFGVTEAEIERVTGMTRAQLESDAATVSGVATYLHLELMFEKPDFPRFLVAAAASHTARSLGVVGLAAKTASTVEAAMRCHHRYQHLTNRTAHYESERKHGRFELRETRPGEARRGLLLTSDYAMLIAVQLIGDLANGDATPLALQSRRADMSAIERSTYEAFVGAPVHLGAKQAGLVVPEHVADLSVASADAELAAYFDGVLSAADRFGEAAPEDPLVQRARRAIRDGLLHGTPTAAEVAKVLGVGVRTLHRRLTALDTSFGDLLDSTRHRLAIGYLADRGLSIGEVAYLVGYREQASFFRAFRRWTGETPTAHRENHPSGSSAPPARRRD
jgi:AraC-like DNA-binding protein